MQLHELQPTHPSRDAKRIGRGGKRGKTSGRGHKGQLARAGNSTRPEVRDTIKRLPKLRGHGVNRARTVNSGRSQAVPVNVSTLEKVYADGATVSPHTLQQQGVIKAVGKRLPLVKVLGQGTLQKKLTVTKCAVSAQAREKIVAAGGTVN